RSVGLSRRSTRPYRSSSSSSATSRLGNAPSFSPSACWLRPSACRMTRRMPACAGLSPSGSRRSANLPAAWAPTCDSRKASSPAGCGEGFIARDRAIRSSQKSLLTVTINGYNIVSDSAACGKRFIPEFPRGVPVMRLNHLNLTVPDVQQTREFFETYFGFRCVAERGRGGLAVLADESGFILALSNFDKAAKVECPCVFHIGFMQ